MAPTVGLLARMSAGELAEWVALYRLEAEERAKTTPPNGRRQT